MIKFSGEISHKCRKFLINRIKTMTFIASSISSIIFIIPFIFMTMYINIIFILFIIIFFLFPLLSFLPPSEKTINKITPSSISINDNLLISKGSNFYYETDISWVTKILDYEDWYYIKFNFLYKNQTYICQKNLLIEGSIEDFENLFKGKIVRKIKH